MQWRLIWVVGEACSVSGCDTGVGVVHWKRDRDMASCVRVQAWYCCGEQYGSH